MNDANHSNSAVLPCLSLSLLCRHSKGLEKNCFNREPNLNRSSVQLDGEYFEPNEYPCATNLDLGVWVHFQKLGNEIPVNSHYVLLLSGHFSINFLAHFRVIFFLLGT